MGLLKILLTRDPEPLWIYKLQIQQPVLLLQPSLLASSTRLHERLCREIAIGQVVVVKLSPHSIHVLQLGSVVMLSMCIMV